MPAPRTITLRFRGKDGQFRLQVDPSEHFTALTTKVKILFLLTQGVRVC